MKIINLENATKGEWKSYDVRETARAVLLDSEGKAAFIYVSNHGYYQLVGGGIDEGESIEEGLRRECLEEAGVKIKNIKNLCEVREIKKFEKQIQNSYCFVAEVDGEKGETVFTELELEYGFETVWENLEEITKKQIERGSSSLAGQYPYERQVHILEEYKKYQKNILK